MEVIPYQDVFQVNNLEIEEYINNGINRVKLSHYTSFETMEIILKNKSLKLNRIDLVNDRKESEYLEKPETYARVFVGCFTHREEESIPQWYMYTPMYDGVKIEFMLDKKLSTDLSGIIDMNRKLLVEYDDRSLAEFDLKSHLFQSYAFKNDTKWKISLTCTDIGYSNDLMSRNPIHRNFDDEVYVDISPLAKIKEKAWDFEEETRIIGLFQTTANNLVLDIPNCMYLPLDLSRLTIRIILNPWSDSIFKSKVESFCKEILKDYRYEIVNSSLHNTLAERKW